MAPVSKKAATNAASKAAALLKKRPTIKKTKVRRNVHFFRPRTRQDPKDPKFARHAIPSRPKMHAYRAIKSALTTETAMKKIEEHNTLIFLCDNRATKKHIRAAVKDLYKIRATKVNTLIRPDGQKKAFVKLPSNVDAVDVANRMGLL